MIQDHFTPAVLPPASAAAAVAELIDAAPEHVVERLRTKASDLQLAYSANTLRGWLADWRTWVAFCRQQDRPTLPADLPSMRAFLEARIAAGCKRATLEHNLATLATMHRLAELPWVMETMEARLMWRGLRRTHLVARQRQAQGLVLEDVRRLQEKLDPEHARDARDAALLAVAFESMCRCSELVALQVDQLTIERDGSGRLTIERSKTDQEGEGAVLYLSPATVEKLQQWLSIAGVQDGVLFRSTPRSNKPNRFARPLSEGDVARIFKKRATAAGLDATRISAHSTRVGAAQDLLAANFSGAAVMKQGRWKSERMVVRYGQNLEAGRGAMAKLLAGEKKERSDA